MKGCDMIASLYHLPEAKPEGKLRIKRAFPGDKEELLTFVETHFNKCWAGEVEQALFLRTCFIATEEGRLCGFACYDATAKGFFGPIGVDPDLRGRNIGSALLLRTLEEMKAAGYGYAIIGWVSGAEMFYRKLVDAEFIKNGSPENSVYSDMIMMP